MPAWVFTAVNKIRKSNMYEMKHDEFYGFIRPYDLDDEYYFVGGSDHHPL